jgi:hypothetical protein
VGEQQVQREGVCPAVRIEIDSRLQRLDEGKPGGAWSAERASENASIPNRPNSWSGQSRAKRWQAIVARLRARQPVVE